MSAETAFVIAPGGAVRFVHDDALVQQLRGEGRVAIARASHVEPDETGHWHADMAPVGGPKLGPYDTRGEALQCETEWLQANDIPAPR